MEEVLTAPFLFYDLNGAISNTCGEHARNRRKAFYGLLEEVHGTEWDKILSCYNIIPASKLCTDQQWACRFGQVFMAVLQYKDTCHIVVDYQIYHNNSESRSKSYHRDIVKGCVIEALLYHCNYVEGFAAKSLVCLAFPVESQLFLDEILPDCVGLSHSACSACTPLKKAGAKAKIPTPRTLAVYGHIRMVLS